MRRRLDLDRACAVARRTMWPRLRRFASNFSTAAKIDKIAYLLDNMPKIIDNTELRLSRTNRQKKMKGKRLPASEISLNVLGNGARGNPRSLYVFTDQARYLFNCGEGTQRIAHEYKAKLARLEHVFITRPTWENVGGLAGLVLTAQSIGLPEITIHGPDRTIRLFQMTAGFMLTGDIGIVKRGIDEGPFEDSVMRVEYAVLTSRKDESTSETNCGDSLPEAPSKRQKVEEPSDACVAYICRPTRKPGHLILEACLDLGVPPGPLLGELKNGIDVTLPCGKLVKSADVMSPDEPSPVFIVVECPSFGYLDSLLENKSLRHCQDKETAADLVVHFTPRDVFSHPKYKEWISRFPGSTEHLVLNESNTSLCSFAVHRIQHKLNMLHPDIFPLLADSGEISEEEERNSEKSRVGIGADTMMVYHLRPNIKLNTDTCVKVDPEEIKQECTILPGFDDALAQLKKDLLNTCTTGNNKGDYPRILFLGTGSSIPSKVRNTSGILVSVSDTQNILMDCGEGTFGQLFRFFGKRWTDEVLRNLAVIFASHMHADHHIGLIQILKERRRAFNNAGIAFEPVILVAPEQIMPWLSTYDRDFEPILSDFRITKCGSVQFNGRNVDDNEYNLLKDTLALKELSTVPVIHCKHAFALTLEHTTGWKLVYSGDTMPCDALVDAGKGCDLLIHEATMEDQLLDDAIMKRHSTTSQAIEIGQRMEAKFTVLTHFSQRYSKVPLFNDNFRTNVGIAFDNMQVSLSNVHCLHHFSQVLKIMFSEHYENMQEKTAKKVKQRERGFKTRELTS